jgi:hypothetical protein
MSLPTAPLNRGSPGLFTSTDKQIDKSLSVSPQKIRGSIIGGRATLGHVFTGENSVPGQNQSISIRLRRSATRWFGTEDDAVQRGGDRRALSLGLSKTLVRLTVDASSCHLILATN